MVTEILQPKLATYENKPFFYSDSKPQGVVFQAPVNGKTTSKSGYPRSELREMRNNGQNLASWRSDNGVHTMRIDQRITHLPGGKPHVVAGQIHDAIDDVTVLRCEGTKLWITKGDNSHFKLIDGSYTLGTRFTIMVQAQVSGIRWFYNNVHVATVGGTYSGCYFKAGCYTQANTSNGTGYGQVVIYSLSVSHV